MAGAQNSGLSVAERRKQREAERQRQEVGRLQASGSGGLSAAPEVPLESLAHNPRNARQNLTDIEGLADTYGTAGVLQPCLVIPAPVFQAAFPEHAADIGTALYVVLGGNRRLAAARRAGLASLPVHVNTRVRTRQEILVAAATENIAREELRPFEELTTIEDLKGELGTYEAVAQALGKTAGWVSQRRRLHRLQPEVREALEERAPGMTIELARELGKIKDRDEQLKAWAAERQRAEQRAADPAKKSAPKTKKSRSKVPAQGKTGGKAAPLDAAAKARREACLIAVAAGAGDLARLSIIAAQSPADPDEAIALASQWLTETGAGSSALALAMLANEEGTDRQQQAALALTLAHCELHMSRGSGADPAHVRAFVDWLETHTDYQPADAEPAPTA